VCLWYNYSPVSICPSIRVCHCETDERIEMVLCSKASFYHTQAYVSRKFGYVQNKDTSVWKFVPSFRHGTECPPLSSKVDNTLRRSTNSPHQSTACTMRMSQRVARVRLQKLILVKMKILSLLLQIAFSSISLTCEEIQPFIFAT